MNLIGGIIAFIYYVVGLATSVFAIAPSLGWTSTIAIVLWTSFFGFTTLVFCMLFWSRDHWLG